MNYVMEFIFLDLLVGIAVLAPFALVILLSFCLVMSHHTWPSWSS